jgi:hypothetical protein
MKKENKKMYDNENQTVVEARKPEHQNPIQVTALESMERASIDMQISTAKNYPMHSPKMLSKVKEDMMTLALLDEETAEACFYTLPRGGKAIQGSSVRLAEIALNCYGNIRIGTRIVDVVSGGDNPHVVIQAVCHDLENNAMITIEKRRRITKKKFKDAIDEDDIQLAVNACTSIAYRDAAFKLIPMAIIKPVCEAAKKLAVGDIKSLTAKRAIVIDHLKKMGATEDRILAVVDCRKVEDIGVDQLGVLIGLGTALKDGETSLEDAFPNIENLKDDNSNLGTNGLKGRLNKNPAPSDKAKQVKEKVAKEKEKLNKAAAKKESKQSDAQSTEGEPSADKIGNPVYTCPDAFNINCESKGKELHIDTPQVEHDEKHDEYICAQCGSVLNLLRTE